MRSCCHSPLRPVAVRVSGVFVTSRCCDGLYYAPCLLCVSPSLLLNGEGYGVGGGGGSFSSEGKQAWQEDGHLTSSNVEVENRWSLTSTVPCTFMACTGTSLLQCPVDQSVLFLCCRMLKHVQLSPFRSRADTMSLNSNSSYSSLSSERLSSRSSSYSSLSESSPSVSTEHI